MCNTTTAGNDLGLTDKNHACACATGAHIETVPQASETSLREQYLVTGMTCGHCVASVTEEVSAIDGVESVSIDLNAGAASRVSVVSVRPVDVDAIRDAVAEAGYVLVPA